VAPAPAKGTEMARNRDEEATIVSISKLDRLAEEHEKTAKTLHKLARAFRGLLSELAGAEASEAPAKGRKRPLKRGKGHSTAAPQPQKKGMSPAARKKLSQMMKVRWAEKRAMTHKPNGQHKKAPVGEALKGQVA